MSRRLMKLVLGSLILAGSFVGSTAKVAEAAWCPPYYCCDSQCNGIRRCWQVGANCVCEQICRFEP